MPAPFKLSEDTRQILKNKITEMAEEISKAKGQLENLLKSKSNIDKMVVEARAGHDRLVASRQSLLDDLQKDSVGP